MVLIPKQATEPNTGKALAEHKRQLEEKRRQRAKAMNQTNNGDANNPVDWNEILPKPDRAA